MKKQKRKTPEEVKVEIIALELLRRKLGDKDWIERVDSQLDVLRNNLNYDEIHGKYGCPGQDDVVLCFALLARDWINGRINLLKTLKSIGMYRDIMLAEADEDYENEYED